MTDADHDTAIPRMLLVLTNAVGWTVVLIVGLALPFMIDMEYMGELFQLMYIVLMGVTALITTFSVLCVPVFVAWELKGVVSNYV